MRIGLIIGGHPCAQAEAAHFRKMYGGRRRREIVTFGVNHAIGKIWCDYLVSHHPDIMDEEYPHFAGPKFTGTKWALDGWFKYNHCKGSSSLLAVHVARAMKCDKIMLCGVHLNDEYSIFCNSWLNEVEELQKDTRSLGGWTKGLLGEPSEEWLND